MILSLYLSLTGLLRNHEKMVCDCDLILLSGQLKLSRRTMEAQPWWESSAWACSRLQSWELSTCSTSSPGWRSSKTGWSRSSSHHPLPHHHLVKGFINVGRSCLKATSKKVFVTLSRRFLLRSIPAQSYHQVSRVEHFSALRFFPISRGTMKGMVATAVTYLIILIQFKSGTPVTPS